MIVLGDSHCCGGVTRVDLSFKEWSDPDSHLDPGATLAPDALPSELLAVSGTPCGMRVRCAVLVLQLVRELLRLAEADLRLNRIVSSMLLVHELMLQTL